MLNSPFSSLEFSSLPIVRSPSDSCLHFDVRRTPKFDNNDWCTVRLGKRKFLSSKSGFVFHSFTCTKQVQRGCYSPKRWASGNIVGLNGDLFIFFFIFFFFFRSALPVWDASTTWWNFNAVPYFKLTKSTDLAAQAPRRPILQDSYLWPAMSPVAHPWSSCQPLCTSGFGQLKIWIKH